MFGMKNDLVTFRNYAAAQRHFENTAPIRGRDKDYDGVPLAQDRRAHRSYYLLRRGNLYQAYLHRTPVVTYMKSGEIEVDVSYNSQLTNNFANRYVPMGVYFSTCRGRLTVGLSGTGGQEFYIDGNVRLTPTENGKFDVSKVYLGVYENLRSKSEAYQMRKPYADTLKIVETMLSIGLDHNQAHELLEDQDLGVYFSPQHLFDSLISKREEAAPQVAAFCRLYTFQSEPKKQVEHFKSSFYEYLYRKADMYEDIEAPCGVVNARTKPQFDLPMTVETQY